METATPKNHQGWAESWNARRRSLLKQFVALWSCCLLHERISSHVHCMACFLVFHPLCSQAWAKWRQHLDNVKVRCYAATLWEQCHLSTFCSDSYTFLQLVAWLLPSNHLCPCLQLHWLRPRGKGRLGTFKKPSPTEGARQTSRQKIKNTYQRVKKESKKSQTTPDASTTCPAKKWLRNPT